MSAIQKLIEHSQQCCHETWCERGQLATSAEAELKKLKYKCERRDALWRLESSRAKKAEGELFMTGVKLAEREMELGASTMEVRELRDIALRNATDCQHLRRTAIEQAAQLAEREAELVSLRTRDASHDRADAELLGAFRAEHTPPDRQGALHRAVERWVAAKGGGK